MYFEPDESITVEEAEDMIQTLFAEMKEYDSKIFELRARLDEIDECDSYNADIARDIQNDIYFYSCSADEREKWIDYWQMQAKWAKERIQVSSNQ